MMRPLPVILAALLGWSGICGAAPYGVARSAAPVLNSPAFSRIFGGADGKSLKTDRCGQVREMEFIALPGTVFRVRETIPGTGGAVYRVETDDYPAPAGIPLYVDSRFIEPRDEEPPARVRALPPRERITATLREAVGAPYVWGGNLREGAHALLGTLYPAEAPLDDRARRRITLAGLDCSGLLYQATNGWTPRNTSRLVAYGAGVAVEGKSAREIAEKVQPLDLIVWNGHVIIVLDRDTAIESRLECGRPGNGGVVETPLEQRLMEIMRTRRPLDAWPAPGKRQGVFVVRRWYGL
ncbi:peptidoglycan endopeptidase [Geobacter sp. FeAm09]|uniref:NlpC/P60 family protein n=1 Tax=Geobacter sp. FeAm09 TaxID=2597769 RepID=UPI0011ED31FA|nr:NlpC/P60 family protein [Geobacter sp. FeAm09]QEM69735.1 peptidoglycan endopeptidase [Geobacter sp. FeAm09]